MTERSFVVPAALDGQRLDRALAELVKRASGGAGNLEVSRAELARWIAAGAVDVAGVAQRRSSFRVKEGFALTVRPQEPEPTDAAPDPSVRFGVVYEDAALIVVDKPAGLVVHPARGHATGTLVNGLLSRGDLAPPDPGSPQRAQARPGIVHRIDKGTSGLLVVARTAVARERLKAAFAAHDIERVYDAIVLGTLPDRVTFDTAYGRHATNRKAFTGKPRTGGSGGKRAVTHAVVVERLEGGVACRVECRLETGRTHQIRVHLSEAGAPLLGDELYGKPPRSPQVRAIGRTLGRQALHARVLGFAHPISGERLRFESPWPNDFRAALDAMRAL